MIGAPQTWLGAVLAGGLSKRMGSDKAEVMIEGVPLWSRQRDVLRSAGIGRVFLVRQPGQAAPEGVPCLLDSVPGIGPLGGLHAALHEAGDSPVAVLAVDMPGIGPDWYAWLSAFCDEGVGAMARSAAGCEPLAAIYPPVALAFAEAAVAKGDYSLQRLALSLAERGHLRLVGLDPAGMKRVQSLNTPLEKGAWVERPVT